MKLGRKGASVLGWDKKEAHGVLVKGVEGILNDSDQHYIYLHLSCMLGEYMARWRPISRVLTHRSRDLLAINIYIYIYIYIYTGSAKKCVHTLTKENSTLYNRLL